jgi:hypothetical protein
MQQIGIPEPAEADFRSSCAATATGRLLSPAAAAATVIFASPESRAEQPDAINTNLPKGSCEYRLRRQRQRQLQHLKRCPALPDESGTLAESPTCATQNTNRTAK